MHIEEIEQLDGSYKPGEAAWLPLKVNLNYSWNGKEDVEIYDSESLDAWTLKNAEVSGEYIVFQNCYPIKDK